MEAYILAMSHGDYDDQLVTPVAIVKDEASAILLREALEAKEKEYVDKVPFVKRFIDLDCGEFSIDVYSVPVVEV